MTTTDSTTERDVRLTVDGRPEVVRVGTTTSLLDALRDRLGNYAPKKGCDHGQCGSCTVILDGRRRLSCLTLAVQHEGAMVTTAAGLGRDEPDGLHPIQRAFVARDALQCGYCTPGQVCSTEGMLTELAEGRPSYVTADLEAGLSGPIEPTEDEIRERLSGNLCRCGAYANIVDAVRDVAGYPAPDRVADAVAVLRAVRSAAGLGSDAAPDDGTTTSTESTDTATATEEARR